jgi:hypothetical protein
MELLNLEEKTQLFASERANFYLILRINEGKLTRSDFT